MNSIFNIIQVWQVETSPKNLFDNKCSIRVLDDKIYFHLFINASGAVLMNTNGIESNSFINFTDYSSAVIENTLTQNSIINNLAFTTDTFNLDLNSSIQSSDTALIYSLINLKQYVNFPNK